MVRNSSFLLRTARVISPPKVRYGMIASIKATMIACPSIDESQVNDLVNSIHRHRWQE